MGSMNELISRGRLVWRLLNDARVPSWIKIGIPLVVVIYFIAPIDLIPDFILGLGQVDDLGVLLIGMSLIIRFAPQYVVDEHRVALGYDSVGTPGGTSNGTPRGQATRKMSPDETIEGEYKVVRPRE
jgi:uncharacterized membrane protein YkvA (DUF1232 family)